METGSLKQEIFPKSFKNAISPAHFKSLMEILGDTDVQELDKMVSDISQEGMMDYCMLTGNILDHAKELNHIAASIAALRINKVITPPGGHKVPKGIFTVDQRPATREHLEVISMSILAQDTSELLLNTILAARNKINQDNIIEGTIYPAVASNLLLDVFVKACMEKFWVGLLSEVSRNQYAQTFAARVKYYLGELPNRLTKGALGINIGAAITAVETTPYNMNPRFFFRKLSEQMSSELSSKENIPLLIEDIMDKVIADDFIIADRTHKIALDDTREVFIRIRPNTGDSATVKYQNIHKLCRIDIYDDEARYAGDDNLALQLEFSRPLLQLTLHDSSFTLEEFIAGGDDVHVSINFYLLSLIYDSLEPVEVLAEVGHAVEKEVGIRDNTESSEYVPYEQTEKDPGVLSTSSTTKEPYEKMRAYSCREIIRALYKLESVQYMRTRGDHYIFKNLQTGKSAVVPDHGGKILNIGILRKTMKTLGITPKILKGLV